MNEIDYFIICVDVFVHGIRLVCKSPLLLFCEHHSRRGYNLLPDNENTEATDDSTIGLVKVPTGKLSVGDKDFTFCRWCR